MFTRRVFVMSSAAAVLAGCQTTTTPQTQAPAATPATPTTAPSDGLSNSNVTLVPANTQALHIVEVDLSLSDDFKNTAPKESEITDMQILDALRSATVPGLKNANPSGDIPVRASIEVTGFKLGTAAGAIIGGGSTSTAQLRVTLTRLDTGAQLGRVATTNAISGVRPNGLIGAAMVQPPKVELALVAENVPVRVKRRLFGFESG